MQSVSDLLQILCINKLDDHDCDSAATAAAAAVENEDDDDY